MVTEQMLRDFFNTALKGLVPEEAATPAVVNVWMAADMKYSFVEMRTPELATSAIALDKVELCGRSLNVGRPSGYVAPPGGGGGGSNPMAGAMAAMQAMGAMGGGPAMSMMGMMGGMMPNQAGNGAQATQCLRLENMLSREDVLGDEYDEIVEDIKDECEKHGSVLKVCVPRPNADGSEPEDIGKAFVKFATVDSARKAMDALSGRTFDGKKVVVQYIDEDSFNTK